MRIVKASAEFIDIPNGALEKIERCGRVCYKSEDRIESGSADSFVARIVASGHESVLEHVSLTAHIVCDRGVSHEIVRHRLASYSQESTRYCDEVTFIEPCYLDKYSEAYKLWYVGCLQAEEVYRAMRRSGCTPQEARAVLPNSLKTELYMTANIREWRHFFNLRTSKRAHPQMCEVANMLLSEAKEKLPIMFSEVGE